MDDLPEDTWPVPPLVGITEAAVVIGVSKQRVHQLLRSGQFPAPVARLAAGPVWRESDINWFATHRDQIARSIARVVRLGLSVGPIDVGSDRQETLPTVADASHKSGETA